MIRLTAYPQLIIFLYLLVSCDSIYRADEYEFLNTEHPLTNDLNTPLFPAWSPDGEQIAYASRHAVTDFVCYSAAGTNLGTFCTVKLHLDSHPAVSPDGRYIASRISDHDFLWLYDRTTESQTEIARKYPRADSAVWSHDSRYIAFKKSKKGAICYSPVISGTYKTLTAADDKTYSLLAWHPSNDRSLRHAPVLV